MFPETILRARRTAGIVVALLVLSGCTPKTPPPEVGGDQTPGGAGETESRRDPETGLILADGWELVRAACVQCHSAQQFLRQRGSRQDWVEITQWMQEREGLGELPEDMLSKILDYLTENHGPIEAYRRAPIPPLLMPRNPYVSDIKKELLKKNRPGTQSHSSSG